MRGLWSGVAVLALQGCSVGLQRPVEADADVYADADADADADTDTGLVFPPPTLAAGDLVVTEIMQNPDAVADEVGEWFEVHNPTGVAIDLLGVIVRNDSGSQLFVVDRSVVVSSGAYVVLTAGDPSTNGGVPSDYQYDRGDFTLGNSDDELVLEAVRGVEVDRVAWDNGATFPDPAGASMSLSGDALDVSSNDDGGSWCVGVDPLPSGDLGSPGMANGSCAPIVDGEGLVITEVTKDPVATGDSDGEWFEVYNTGPSRSTWRVP